MLLSTISQQDMDCNALQLQNVANMASLSEICQSMYPEFEQDFGKPLSDEIGNFDSFDHILIAKKLLQVGNNLSKVKIQVLTKDRMVIKLKPDHKCSLFGAKAPKTSISLTNVYCYINKRLYAKGEDQVPEHLKTAVLSTQNFEQTQIEQYIDDGQNCSIMGEQVHKWLKGKVRLLQTKSFINTIQKMKECDIFMYKVISIIGQVLQRQLIDFRSKYFKKKNLWTQLEMPNVFDISNNIINSVAISADMSIYNSKNKQYAVKFYIKNSREANQNIDGSNCDDHKTALLDIEKMSWETIAKLHKDHRNRANLTIYLDNMLVGFGNKYFCKFKVQTIIFDKKTAHFSGIPKPTEQAFEPTDEFINGF